MATCLQAFLKTMNTSCAVRSYVPMGLGMGFPMLNIAGDTLLVSVFYYRSILRPEDRTLLMPPEYMLSFEYPNARLALFQNLRVDPRYSAVDFAKPLGTFRHAAILHLDRQEYKAHKEALYALLDRLTAYLGGEGAFSGEDEKKLSELFTMLTEPPLHPFYRAMAPQFYQRFIAK